MSNEFNWRDQVAGAESAVFAAVEKKVKAASTLAFLAGWLVKHTPRKAQ